MINKKTVSKYFFFYLATAFAERVVAQLHAVHRELPVALPAVKTVVVTNSVTRWHSLVYVVSKSTTRWHSLVNVFTW